MKMKLPIYIQKRHLKRKPQNHETVCVSENGDGCADHCFKSHSLRSNFAHPLHGQKSRQTPGYTRDFLLSLPPDQVYIISLIRLQG